MTRTPAQAAPHADDGRAACDCHWGRLHTRLSERERSAGLAALAALNKNRGGAMPPLCATVLLY